MSIPTKQDIIVALKATDVTEALDELYAPICGDRYGAWDGGECGEGFLVQIGGEDYVDFSIRIEYGEPLLPPLVDCRGPAVRRGYDEVAEWMLANWPSIMPPQTLGGLLLALQDGRIALGDDLPTFGGRPIRSWNETQVLVGEDFGSLRIIDRDD